MKTKKNKKRNLFIGFTIMFSLLTISFKFDENNIYWFWQDKIPIAIFLIIMAIIFAILWFKEQKKIKI